MSLEEHFNPKARKTLAKLAKILELNDIWPMWPIVISIFEKMLVKFSKNEKFRIIALVNQDSGEYIPIADIEEARIRGKQIELGEGDEFLDST